MNEVSHVNEYTLVVIPDFSVEAIMEGINMDGRRIREKEMESGHKLISKLVKLIPDFLDGTTRFVSFPLGYSGHFEYSIPLAKGRLDGKFKIVSDLGELIAHDIAMIRGTDEESERKRIVIAQSYGGKAGIAFQGDYHLGRMESQQLRSDEGLHLGYTGGGLSCSVNEQTYAFEEVLNSLCQEKPLSERAILDRWKHDQRAPLYYYDGCQDIKAIVKDLSIKNLSGLDESVGVFMQWMQQERPTINACGKLVRLAVAAYDRSEELRKEEESQFMSLVGISEMTVQHAKQYFQRAQEIFALLSPPKNNRMDYLYAPALVH